MNEKTVDQTDALIKTGGDEGTATEVPLARPEVSRPDTLEAMYQKIGWWKGPNATPEARALVCDFWRGQGEEGLRWLVSRLRPESHVDLLDGVASALAQIGDTAILPILDELERQPSRDQAEALLKALGWLGEQGNAAPPSLAARLGLVLKLFLRRDEPSLREQAARAAALVPRQRAVDLLANLLNSEPDADVRQAIEETVTASATK